MASVVMLQAIRALQHRDQPISVGDVFEATQQEAVLHIYQRKAVFAPTRTVQTRAMTSEPSATDSRKPKRHYKRRDMVPEP